MGRGLESGEETPKEGEKQIAHFNPRGNYAYGGLDYTLE
jgi:hypothetical protein